MLLVDVVSTSAQVAATRSRGRKAELLAASLRAMHVDELAVGTAFLAGAPRQPRLDVGWAALSDVTPPPADRPVLSLLEVDRALAGLTAARGPGSGRSRRDALGVLLSAATAPEQRFLRALVLGELRQGALEGVMTQAVARAFAVPEPAVRRALMLRGDLGAVAQAAARGGPAALRAFRLTLFQPLRPMLAQTSADLTEALGDLAEATVEYKFDGARVQVHRDGDEVRIYSRSLREVTGRLDEVVAALAALPASRLILDGEVIALRPGGRPQAFQDTMRRFGREHLPAGQSAGPAAVPFFFDCLHVDGEDLLDRPLADRIAALGQVVPDHLRVPGRVVAGVADGAVVLDAALRRGHEGVMVKALDAVYEAGRRGAAWRKVKPVHTLDLVVLAAEWGHGRRRGWLSNLHLGARDHRTGGFVMLGKTFKGMTDETLAWQTRRLLELEQRRTAQVVHVRPQLVVEVAFDGVQASPRYPGGVALRFARVKGYRPDKDASEADTIDAVRALHATQQS